MGRDDPDAGLDYMFSSKKNELQAAKEALSPKKQPKDHPTQTFADEPSLPKPWSVPTHLYQNPATTDSLNSATASGQAAYRDQQDAGKLLQYGLSLQELAARLGPTAGKDQHALLQQACEIYALASRLESGQLAAVLFNWAVALSDISRLLRVSQVDEAIQCLTLAAEKYAQALVVDPHNPQALNNWALVLNDLQTLLPEDAMDKKAALIPQSVARFRAAIRLHPETDVLSRFAYNLGTVLYAQACALQDQTPAVDDKHIRSAFAHASQYIILSYALQPRVGASQESLAAVQRLLPLPHLRAGRLQGIATDTVGTAHESWVTGWFALDVHHLQCVRPPASEMNNFPGAVPDITIDLGDVSDAQICLDPSLPEGYGIWLASQKNLQGIFLVSETREDAEGWVDAINLLLQVRKSEVHKDRLSMALLARRMR